MGNFTGLIGLSNCTSKPVKFVNLNKIVFLSDSSFYETFFRGNTSYSESYSESYYEPVFFFGVTVLYCTVESYSTCCEANLHFAINDYLHIP